MGQGFTGGAARVELSQLRAHRAMRVGCRGRARAPAGLHAGCLSWVCVPCKAKRSRLDSSVGLEMSPQPQ